jgi:hypothetical protein
MAGVEIRNFESADETRALDRVTLSTVKVGDVLVGRGEMQPGWRWSEDVKPIVGTESCGVHHVGIALAGRIHVVHTDGSEGDLAAGDVYEIQPGHDAWVVGDEAFVGVEFNPEAAATYGKA